MNKTPPGIRVREAGPNDFPVVQDLEHRLREEDKHFRDVNTQWPLSKEGEARIAERLSGNGICFLTELALPNELVVLAHLRGVVDRPSATIGALAVIESLFVDPKYRRLRVATQLLNHFREWGSQQGADSLTVDVSSRNAAALKFCERQGMVIRAVRLIDHILPGDA